MSDVIPLNFLLHYSDRQLINNYHKVAGIKHLAHTRTNQALETRTQYARKAHNQQIDRYQAGNIKLDDKKDQETHHKAITTDKEFLNNEPKSYHLDQLQQVANVPNTNKLQLASTNKDPLSLHQESYRNKSLTQLERSQNNLLKT